MMDFFEALFGGNIPEEEPNKLVFMMDDFEKKYIIDVSVPGYGEGDIDFTIKKDKILVYGGKKGNPKEGVKAKAFRRQRTFDEPIDESKIKTHYHDGVLSIIIPKQLK